MSVSVDEIVKGAQQLQKEYPCYRWGQAVFNYVDMTYGVARDVQFKDKVDCFYRDDYVTEFIEKSLIRINNLGKDVN